MSSASIATGVAKSALKKVQWTNFLTYAKISVWVSIVGMCILPGYLIFKVIGELSGESILWALLSGGVEILCGLVVAFFEVIPCLKCCEKCSGWATKMDLCMSLPMLRSFLYLALSVGQGVLIVYGITKSERGKGWMALMMVPPIFLLVAGALYTVSFIVNDKCKWSKPGSGTDSYNNMNELQRCTMREAPQSEWDPENGKKCKICGTNFGIFKGKNHCRYCGNLVCKNCSKHTAVPSSGPKAELRMCNSCKRRDDEAPKTAGEKMKAGFSNFGKKVTNVFKKNPFAKGGGGGDESGSNEQRSSARASSARASGANPFSSRRNNDDIEAPKPKASRTNNPFRR